MELERANKELNDKRDELAELERSGNDISVPKSGSVAVLQYTKLLKDSYRTQLLGLRHKISYYEQSAYKAKYEVKAAQMDFEKFNHLHMEEVKKNLKKIEVREAGELDEIASLRHYSANVNNKERR